MAPLIHEFSERPEVEAQLVTTGQHREMTAQLVRQFNLKPLRDLDLMREQQALPPLTARLIEGISETLAELEPDVVLAQGDTTTVFATALAAFYAGIPLGHVEAGLRSHDMQSPWPEEMNRRLVAPLARWCFAPTERARENLLHEGIADERIHVTGNTVIDALLWMRERVRRQPPAKAAALAKRIGERRLVLVTGHRRESFGDTFEGMCRAMRRVVEAHEDVLLAYPVHLNPNVRRPVEAILAGHPRIALLEPMPYDAFVWLLDRSHLVMTDSGGVQEEAPALGKPVVVMRETSERPEAVESGNSVIAGTSEEAIFAAADGLLGSEALYARRARVSMPFGDGHAARRIADILVAEPSMVPRKSS